MRKCAHKPQGLILQSELVKLGRNFPYSEEKLREKIVVIPGMVYKNLTQRKPPFVRTKQSAIAFCEGSWGGGGVDFFQCVLILKVCVSIINVK